MNLEKVAEKLTGVAEKIQAHKGPLELFGLFHREGPLDLWDIVIAAKWLKAGIGASFAYVADHLREALTEEEMTEISRIVILEHDGTVLQSFRENFGNRTGLADIHFVTEGGAIIRQVYIIVNRPVASKGRPKNPKKPRRSQAGS
jgi:hypothetical protein